MSDETHEPSPTHHVAGLALAAALTGLSYLIWRESAWLAGRIGLPELRILLALTGGFLALSLANMVASWRQ